MRDRLEGIIWNEIAKGIDKALRPEEKPKPDYYDLQIERINKTLAGLEQIEAQTPREPEQTQMTTPSETVVAHRESPIEAQPGAAAPGEGATPQVLGVACIPCINNHFSACAGLVSDEGMRMALRGSNADEVIRRLNRCLDQLNAMEREDLAPEKIARLSPAEKELAIYAQKESAEIRHSIENITTLDDLETVAVHIIQARDKIGKDYFKLRLKPQPELSLEEAKKLAAEEAARKVEERWH